MDVRLRAKIDAETVERGLEGGHHRVVRVDLVELGCAEESRDVPRACIGEPDSEACAEETVTLRLPERLGLVEKLATLGLQLVEAEAEPLVELVRVRRAELEDGIAIDRVRLQIHGVQVLVEQTDALRLESPATVAVGLVRDRPAEHPVRDLLAVDRRLEGCLDRGRARLVLAGQVAEEALACEAPELGRRPGETLRGVETRELLVPLVDRLDVERFLQPCVVEVELLVQLGDEPVSIIAQGVELTAGRGVDGHGP